MGEWAGRRPHPHLLAGGLCAQQAAGPEGQPEKRAVRWTACRDPRSSPHCGRHHHLLCDCQQPLWSRGRYPRSRDPARGWVRGWWWPLQPVCPLPAGGRAAGGGDAGTSGSTGAGAGAGGADRPPGRAARPPGERGCVAGRGHPLPIIWGTSFCTCQHRGVRGHFPPGTIARPAP